MLWEGTLLAYKLQNTSLDQLNVLQIYHSDELRALKLEHICRFPVVQDACLRNSERFINI
jgi:hypothetical protein